MIQRTGDRVQGVSTLAKKLDMKTLGQKGVFGGQGAQQLLKRSNFKKNNTVAQKVSTCGSTGI